MPTTSAFSLAVWRDGETKGKGRTDTRTDRNEHVRLVRPATAKLFSDFESTTSAVLVAFSWTSNAQMDRARG